MLSSFFTNGKSSADEPPDGTHNGLSGLATPSRHSRKVAVGDKMHRHSFNIDRRTPGLLMLQIDGLAFSEFERALANHRLSFLAGLIHHHRFQARPFYSGLPSATPAVQGELFFGVRTAVPAFQYIDRAAARKVTMAWPWSAEHVARQLEKDGRPLLFKGRSYANIYVGGADQARYCVQTMRLDTLLHALNPIRLMRMMVFYFGSILKMTGYAATEFFLGLADFFRGIMKRKNIFKELKFIPTRVFLCIVLRELIRLRLKMDIKASVPVMHANFMGYDEQAHRRGPSSAFAHWTLIGYRRCRSQYLFESPKAPFGELHVSGLFRSRTGKGSGLSAFVWHAGGEGCSGSTR